MLLEGSSTQDSFGRQLSFMAELTLVCLGNIKESGVIFGERLNHQSSITVSEMFLTEFYIIIYIIIFRIREIASFELGKEKEKDGFFGTIRN